MHPIYFFKNNICIFFFLAIVTPGILAQNIKFEHLTTENGLSHAQVGSIIQDKQGFMWFGTFDGLNKFDGYNFTVYRHNSKDSTSIINNMITNLTNSTKYS